MNIGCHQHPREPARWHDPAENLGFCSRCVVRDVDDARRARTRVGNISVTALATDTGSIPLRVASCVRFPSDLKDWVLWSAMTGAGLAVQWGPFPAFASLAGIALAGSVVATVIIPTTASEQRFSWSALDPATLVRFVVLHALCAVIVGALWVQASARMSALGWPLLSLLLPIAMLCCVSDPEQGPLLQRCQAMVSSLGVSYGVLVVLAGSLMGGCAVIVSAVRDEFSGPVSTGLASAAAAWAMCVFYRVLHAVFDQYPSLLSDAVPTAAASVRARKGYDSVLASVDWYLREGDLFSAERALWKGVKQRPQYFPYHDMLGKMLDQRHDKAGLQTFLDMYLSALLAAGDVPRLILFYTGRYRGRSDYRPATAALRVEFASFLRRQGYVDDAAGLLLNLHHEFPNYTGMADAYWLLVELLADDLGRPELARPSALFILERYPDYPNRARVEAFIRQHTRTGP